MPFAPSHYEVLGVPRDATAADLTAARNRLLREHHPDHNPHAVRTATLRAQAINAAYEVLADDQRRRTYDAELSREQPAGFEFLWGDVQIVAANRSLLYAARGRRSEIAVDSITRVLVRPSALARSSATLVIATTSGRHSFRLPRDAAEALADAISSL